MPLAHVGIDLCKAQLDVAIELLGESISVSNDAGDRRRVKRLSARYVVVRW